MVDNSEKIKLLNQLLQNGQITEDMFNENVDKLTSLKQDVRPVQTARAEDLSGVMQKLRENKGMVKNISDDIKTASPGMAAVTGRQAIVDTMGKPELQKQTGTSLGRLNAGKMGKTMKMLAAFGPIAGAMSMSGKAMAGDFGGAAMEGADLATDYVPGVGQIKDAIRPEEIGNSELPQEEMAARRVFNEQARKGKMGEPTRHSSFSGAELEDEDETASVKDLNDITKRFNVLNKMK